MMAPMELTDRVAVVTGGASGIGRALAWRLAEEGARGVVVADLDAPGRSGGGGDIGARALGVGCDVADEQQVVDLVAAAEDAFGPVDLFCANAGVAVGTDLDDPRGRLGARARRQRPRARLRRQGAACPGGSSAARATSSPPRPPPGCSPRSAPRPTR